ATKELSKVIEACFKSGVAVIGAGISTIRIAPPLVITEELIDRALNVLEKVLVKVSKEVLGK
ncbi:MAG: hypothetical protein B6U85_06745, partial [Desulfurococcales archaeon ex4484_42]